MEEDKRIKHHAKNVLSFVASLVLCALIFFMSAGYVRLAENSADAASLVSSHNYLQQTVTLLVRQCERDDENGLNVHAMEFDGKSVLFVPLRDGRAALVYEDPTNHEVILVEDAVETIYDENSHDRSMTVLLEEEKSLPTEDGGSLLSLTFDENESFVTMNAYGISTVLPVWSSTSTYEQNGE